MSAVTRPETKIWKYIQNRGGGYFMMQGNTWLITNYPYSWHNGLINMSHISIEKDTHGNAMLHKLYATSDSKIDNISHVALAVVEGGSLYEVVNIFPRQTKLFNNRVWTSYDFQLKEVQFGTKKKI